MDAGISTRPVAGAAVADYARPTSAPIQQAVATELAPDKAVTAAPSIANMRQDPLSAQNVNSRQYLIDPLTSEVILRVIDTRTHQIVRQVPDQALLRMRAYAVALKRGDSPTEAELQTDMSA